MFDLSLQSIAKFDEADEVGRRSHKCRRCFKFVGQFHAEVMAKIGVKALGNYSASI